MFSKIVIATIVMGVLSAPLTANTDSLPEPVYAKDDYDLAWYGDTETVDIERTEFLVQIKVYNTAAELQSYYNDIMEIEDDEMTDNDEIRGFTITRRDQAVCYIHIVNPYIWDNREAMAITGHELFHCTLAKHRNPHEDSEDY